MKKPNDLVADAWEKGARAAADAASAYNASSVHPFRLEDMILSCLKIRGARKILRKNPDRVPERKDSETLGFAVGLSECHRLSGNSTAVQEAARNWGLTIQSAKTAGCTSFDLRELRKAGVPSGAKK